MLIKHRITFRKEDVPGFVDYLSYNNISYKSGEIISVLEIYENHPHWEYISMYVQNGNMSCRPETIFTTKELQSAEWLRMRSKWRFGYPQPEGNFAYKTITYSKENYCSNCGSGLTQIDSFRIKKAPKWGSRNFMELNWIGDELFLSEKAKLILQDACITGITFRDVKNSSGKETHEGIEQLVVTDILEKGLVDTEPSIRRVTLCPECGTTKYLCSGVGMLTFKKEIFANAPDIVKSFEIFGDRLYAARVILVNHKVYDVITKNKLDRNLEFAPLKLI